MEHQHQLQQLQVSHQQLQSPHQQLQSPHQQLQSPHQQLQSPHQQLHSPHQQLQLSPPFNCHDCGLVFDSSKSLEVHLHYHKENLVTKWGTASGSEDNNNVKKTRTPTAAETSEFQFFDYSENNSAFQRIQQRPSYRYQPYTFERMVTSTQVQCEKCGFICDQSMLPEHDATAHPTFFEFIKEEQQAEILDLDSHKVVYQQPQGEENLWLDRRYFKEENGNQSPDFASVSTTMSSPTSSEVPAYFEQPQMMQLNSSQLPKYPVMTKGGGGGGGGAWKSNEARRPKTYNCSACNKWFTSSGHLKRHYNTTLHKNAVKQSGIMDPATMPMSSHHHPPQTSPLEEKFQFPPQPEPQEDFQDFFQYPNGMPPHTTNFNEPLPSFAHIQSSISGFSSVGGLLATVQELEVPEVTSTEQTVVHKCVDCDKTFNKACYLTQHNKSFHSGEKPFKCQRCGKRFTAEYLHQEHLSKHAGEKPYKCEMCPKQFNHKTDLRRHMCLHSGDKPYACDFCGKGFIRKDHMLKHAETHKKKALASSYKKMEIDPRLHLRVM
ncbi:unnamed protein product [Nezara viridula]|uniref:C2H2-type domain-containing protein n=1 Tax=Nezara viridula TaxID=85310 RepID=A0A9P0H434_NEZVI|nr:unnamed protein product [Nezara viridula]